MFWNTDLDSSPSAESVRKVNKLTTTCNSSYTINKSIF